MKHLSGEILNARSARILKGGIFCALLFAATVLAIWFSTSPALAVNETILPGCSGCHESQGLRDTPQTLDCGAGACHSTTNATQVSGSHSTHLKAASGIGPDAMVCDTCHGAGATTADHDGHLNARINFIGADEVLSVTGVCASCHSPGGGYDGVDSTGSSVGAKDNWATGVYSGLSTLSLNKEKWCVGCHDDDGPTLNGRQAPSVGGDGNLYGFFKSGHGLDSGTKYDGSVVGVSDGNDGAGKDCSDCHEFQYDHIDGTDGTGTSGANGQRLKDDINSRSVTTVDDVCRNCHSVDGESPLASPVKASAHGNADSASTGGQNDYTKIEPAYFSVKCQQCHDPHSGKLNDEGTRNLQMIRPDVIISESPAATGSVVFSYRGNDASPFPGTNSFDEADTEESDPDKINLNAANNNDDICVTCHVNPDNPGYQMSLHAGAFGHNGPLDNRGKICTNCHPHYYGGLADTTNSLSDGFMPDASGQFCGSCHDVLMSTLDTQSHQTHFRYYYTKNDPVGNVVSLKGPGILVCDVCHGIGAGDTGGTLDESHHEGHQNGKVNFQESSQTVLAAFSSGYTGSVTNACDSCHSPEGSYNGVDTTGTSVGAKDNWVAGVYSDSRTISSGKEEWCVGCHDESPSVVAGVADNVDATDTPTSAMTAANMAGNDTTYGAFASGHNKQSGSYDETTTMAGGSGNAAANKGCDTCHDLGVQHLNRSNDTSMAGQRITEVNGVTIAANAAPSAVCKACHQNAGGPDVAVNQVSDHGNTGEGYTPIESTMAAVGCATCHEGHGLNENANDTRNLRMVRSVIEVTTTPPTTTSIVFERTTGLNSMDTSDADDSDDICAACHSNSNNPGYAMVRHDGGDHTTNDTASIFYNFSGADKRETRCTACHEHNYKEGEGGDIVTDANAFMPRASSGSCAAGEACHASTTVDQTSGSHDTHFSGSAIGPSLLTCDACHGIGASPNGQHEGHANGTVNFQENATSTLSNTSVCGTCHSSGGGYDGVDDAVTGAKSNWADGVYMAGGTTLTAGKEAWCVGCHDSDASDIGIKAPAIGGDASAYGFYVSGHGLDGGSSYDETSTGGGNGNLGAGKECQKCHDLTSQHLNSLDGTGLAGQRVKDDINGNPGLTTVTEACQACHTYENNNGPDTASNAAKVSPHGNSLDGGYTPQIEGPFATNCAQCHELHGNNLNSDTTRNLKMIRSDILISETTGTTGNVVFTARTGTDSFDESDSTATEDNDDLCATCHSNADNPGNPMVRHTGGDHDVPDGLGSDQRGNDCTACHSHNYQEDTPTLVNDGFMPLGACGDCHPAVMNDPLFVTNGKGGTFGSHVTHFDDAQTGSNWSLKGPGITVCDVCHGLDAGNHVGHMNGVVNFKDGATTELVDTDACNDCHSQAGVFDGVTTGTADVGAKGYWISGVYDDTATLTSGNELWCAGCHDDAPSEMLVGTPTVSTMTAPNKIGNNATYGFYESGHGTTTTATYDSTTTGVNGGNNGAGKECAICHDLTTDHINTTDGTGTSGQRILANINGQPVADIDDACKACHQNSGPDESTLTVSGHGNSGADGYSAIESAMVVPGCASCHELHGDNLASGSRNLRMIRNDVLISEAVGTTAAVDFKRVNGNDSFDADDGDDTNNLCRVCHANENMQRNDGGDHTDTVAASIFYNALTPNKRGEDCTACHRHEYKSGGVGSDDAFMPGYYDTFGLDNTCDVTECHNDTIANQTSGSHGTHFTGNKGPSITLCDSCHGANASSGAQIGHDDTTITFSNETTIGATLACDICHSPGGGYDGVDDAVTGVKQNNNWTDGVYVPAGTTLTAGKETWCVGCHDSSPSQINVSGTTMSAPAAGGDASAYGYYVSGHGLDSGSNYDESSIGGGGGNVGANKECQKCHDLSSQHLNTTDDTGLAGQRVNTDINGNSGLTTVTEACQACHTYENNNGPETASNASKVARHGNEGGYSPKIEGLFTTNCAQCHELHGNNLNSSDTTRNLKMIRADILVSETTGTTGNVVFTARTGTDSFDESDSTATGDNDDLCATCHSNADNPGSPMVRHTGGSHDGSGGLGSDERGNDCITCHSHNYQEDTPTLVNDAFMPLVSCGGCHPAVPSDARWSSDGKDGTFGSHVTHFDYLSTLDDWSLKGPGIELCDVCHGINAGNVDDPEDVGTGHHPGHQNGVVNFNESSTTVIGATTVCDDCHSKLGVFDGVDAGGGSVGAKDNWAAGVYDSSATLTAGTELWCAGCHDDAPSEMLVTTPTPTPMTAPNKIGDNATYGFYESGHGTTTTATYDSTTTGVAGGNNGAGKECAICHDLTTDHINTTDGTGTSGQRILANINGQPVADIDDACKACHQNSGPDESTLTVSGHGNEATGGYITAIEGPMTVPGCAACHELHGDNLASGSRNLRMIRNDVLISEGTTAAVDFKRVSGNDSFDANDGDDTNNICRVCHANENMQRNDGGDHTDTVSASIFYNALTPNKRGEDCTACHRHEYKSGDGTSDDAFMPGFYDAFDLDNTCDVTECHNAKVVNQTSGSHSTHFTSNKGPSLTSCNDCHSTAPLGIGDHSGHDDTTITFSSDTTIGATLACDTCHSKNGGYDGVNDNTIGVKQNNNWTDGVYVPAGTTLTAGKEQWCVGCHDSDPSNIVIDAPAVGGDDSAYGAYVSGHNKASGRYDTTQTEDGGGITGNLAATLLCEDCHDLSLNHLNGVDDSNTTDQRIRGNINSVAVGSLFDACKACHKNNVGTQVSSHGNSEATGYSRVETDTAVFTVECLQCHEPHGNNLVAASRNLRMVRNDVLISETTGTTAPIVFKSTTGANSGDGDDGLDSDDICAACHVNSDNPGAPMNRHDGGKHDTTDPDSIFFGESSSVTNKLGEDCTDCHMHDYEDDVDVSEDEGFMPGLSSAGCSVGQSGCHGTTTSNQTSGSHITHFSATDTADADSLKGPGIQTCEVCHPLGADDGSHSSHINGEINFLGVIDTTLSVTTACDSCHSSAGGYDGVDDAQIGAKNNWTNGVYDDTVTINGAKDQWCVGCHDASPSLINVSGTTMSAPAAGGDASTYGAFISGHNKAAGGRYDTTETGDGGGTSGNSAADKGCSDCHDLGSQHLNTTNDTNTAGQRILATINTQSVGGTIDGVCQACHQDGGGDLQVSGHGNEETDGYSAIESAMVAPGCADCHELHGNNLASGSRNLRMIRNDVLISEGTTAAVDFKRVSGNDSFDADDGDDTNNICRVCHANENMQRNDGGDHTDTVSASIFYNALTPNKRGEDCTACHRHEYKSGGVGSDDAFMPGFYSTFEAANTCDVTECHNATVATQDSGSHDTHFTGNNKGPGLTDSTACTTCHGNNASPNGAHSGHDDTTVTFSLDTTIGATLACNICHSPNGGFNGVDTVGSSIGAKDNWIGGVYDNATTLTVTKVKWCVGCHDSDPSQIKVGVTTETAPDIGGDNTEYGFYISGHGLSGTYGGPTTTDTTGGNTGANKRCENCHDLSDTHLDNNDGTGTTGANGQRIKDSINALAVSSIADVCENCHQVTTGSPANKKVSNHGNTTGGGYTDPIEPATFATECAQCHDPHSGALNAEGRRNLRMVRPDVKIADGVFGDVVFENTGDDATGTNSFDEKDIGETSATGSNDDICTTCHVNSSNPGNPTVDHYGGLGHDSGATDNRGKVCTTCHNHAGFGSTYTIADAFMPAGCDGCHGQPPLSADDTDAASPPRENYEGGGGAHLRHQNSLDPVIYAGTNLCTRCHADDAIGSGQHDEVGDGTFERANVNIDFYSATLGDSTSDLGFSLTSIDNSSSVTSATASLPAATTTPSSCTVGCHNPRVLSPVTEPTSEGLSNVATWTARSIACVDCHDSQGKMVDSTTQTTQAIQGVTYISGHDRVDTSDATDATSGARLNRQDCLRCHYNVTGVESQDGSHTRGTVVVRNPENTGTPIVWDASVQATQESLCLGCHDSAGMPSGWELSGDGTDPLDIETHWTDTNVAPTAHRTGGNSSPTVTGFGCVGDATVGGTGCHGSPHGSAKPKLLAAANASGGYEETFCLGCHNAADLSTNAGGIEAAIGYPISVDTANNDAILTVATSPTIKSTPDGNNLFDSSMVGKYFKFVADSNYTWAKIWAVTDSTNIVLADSYLGASTSGEFYIRNNLSTHPVGEQTDEHDNRSEQQALADYNWNPAATRHVECLDCHNVHRAAPPSKSEDGSSAISRADLGIWGVDVQYETAYTQGLANFTADNGSVTGVAPPEGGSAPAWDSMPGGGDAVGWRIKNNYDKSGSWYTVTNVNSAISIDISPSWDATWTASGGVGTDVDYTMVKVSYSATTTIVREDQLCLKCKSSFAYSTGQAGTDSPPESPSGMWDWNGTSVDLVYIDETEVGADFAPTHLAIHPVMALGKNQPLAAGAVNPNWPTYAQDNVGGTGQQVALSGGGTIVTLSNHTNDFLDMDGSGRSTIIPGWRIQFGGVGSWYKIKSIDSATVLTLETAASGGPYTTFDIGAGLGNNFIPPFGPWGRVTCTDCHATYKGATGPHGSANKWNLKGTTTTIEFLWWDDTDNLTTITPNNMSAGTGGFTDAATEEILCFNCHRRDVYGDEGVNQGAATRGNLARVMHAPDPNGYTFEPNSRGGNRWAVEAGAPSILCLTCHGGDSLGGMHGTSAGQQRLDNDGDLYVPKTGTEPKGGVDSNLRGERFLNGATWIAVKRATTTSMDGVECWTKSVDDDINSCTQGHNSGSSSQEAMYNY